MDSENIFGLGDAVVHEHGRFMRFYNSLVQHVKVHELDEDTVYKPINDLASLSYVLISGVRLRWQEDSNVMHELIEELCGEYGSSLSDYPDLMDIINRMKLITNHINYAVKAEVFTIELMNTILNKQKGEGV